MKTLRLETTAPFQGLAELVADDEGLFEKEGIKIEWMDREKGVDKSAQMHITSHKDAGRFLSHGKMMEQGKADLYNACEWGNYSRVETTKVGSRQVGRRSIVTFAALVVRRRLQGADAAAVRQRADRRPDVQRHALSVPADAGRLRAARPDQDRPRAERLQLPLQVPDGRHHRSHHADRAVHLARREAGLPRRHLGVPSRHGSGVRSRRCRDLCRVQSRGARGRAPHQRQQGGLHALLHRLLSRASIRRSISSRSKTCARAASISSIRRRSRPTSCSAPTTG